MRILFVMLSVSFAGTERHAVELANELSRQEHEVAIMLRRRPPEPHRQSAYETLREAISPTIRVFEAPRAAPMFTLWRTLAVFRPHIIHAHHERGVRLACRHAVRVPVIATIHSHFKASAFAACDGLICLTDSEAYEIPEDYTGLVRVICNWVLPHQPPPEPRLAGLRVELGIAEDDYVIGTVCRLEPVKGVADLITAFHAAGLRASRLLIVGDGSLREELEQLAASLGIAERVRFAGFRKDVRDLYYLFDLFVLNSVDEPFPLAVLEAASSGLPVIATATLGATSMAESLALELVPPASPDKLADALGKLYQRSAPTYDMSEFAVEAKADATLAAYRAVIDTRRPMRRSLQNRHQMTSTAA